MASLPVKYRPQTFEDVVGQGLICRILQNQVAARDFRPLYLFAGSAGTGKTTIARLFAKAIVGNERDFVELDAASHNGVDAVVELREDAYFHPMTVGNKVYIIDECHSLSGAAFNALLKLLEEPPDYAIFILCTTDPGKLPLTILSRAQRYNFQRYSLDELLQRLHYVAEHEGRAVDEALLGAIAGRARGGMRDAISLLDAAFAYVPVGRVRFDEVAPLLGLFDEGLYWAIVEACVAHDAMAVGQLVQQVHTSGRDWSAFFSGWTEHLLHMREAQVLGHPVWGQWADEERALRVLQAFDTTRLLRWLDSSMDTLGKLRYDPLPLLRIEAYLWGLAEEGAHEA